MATNIEQIFRSFVVSKFREIQEQQQQQQQFGGGKIGSQYNGEINSPEHTSSSDDNIGSVGNLQNDPLVQKIEQVLSEVLAAESQYKPGGGEDAVRSKSRSVKRGLSEEVQDEIPRKKSKKDKKHKDKKKKKKRKKEKKHKKQSKESKLNDQQKECEDLQRVLHSEPENPCFILSAGDDVNIESASVLQHASVSVQEETAYENENSAMPNSHNTNSDSSRLDTSKEDSTLVSAHELSEVKLASERELESGTFKTTDLTLNLCIEDQSLRTAEAEGSSVSMVRDEVICLEQNEISSALEATKKLNVPENSSHSITVQPEYLETSLESNMLKVKSLDSVTDSLNPEGMKQSTPTLLETPALPHLELSGEAKDSVTTLGFLAMVVGKDFEATSEFLNTAKIKASERSPRHISFTDMKDDNDSERLLTMQDFQKALQPRTEMKAAPESQHVVSKNDFELALVSKLKPQQTDSRTMVEFGEQKCMAATADAEAIVKELRETQVSAVMMELKDSEKYPRQLQIEKVAKNVSQMPELEMKNKTDLTTPLSNVGMETRTLDSVSGFQEIDLSCLKEKSATKKEKWNTVPEPFRMMNLKNVGPLTETEEAVKVNSSLEAVVVEKEVSEIAEDLEPVTEVNIPENISQTLETAPGIGEIVKPQNQEVSQYASKISESGMNLKDLKNASESLATLKNVETTSESQYVKGMSYIHDTLQSDAVSRGKNLQTNLEVEGKKEEKDVDTASESLHMIFTNYSEQNLELFSEPKVMTKLKSSDIVPQSSHMGDANSLESQHIRKVKDLKMVGSEMMVGLNDLQKKIECHHRNVKIVEAALECKAVSDWTALDEKASDTIENMTKDQYSAGADHLRTSPRYEEVNNGSKTTTGNELTAESENLSLTSKFSKDMDISSETAAELEALAVVQKLKERVGFTTRVEEDSPKESLELKSSVSTDLKDYPKSVNIGKCFESISESQKEQNLQSVQDTTSKRKEVNLDSLYDLETEYAKTSSEFHFIGALSNQEGKQKFQERTEMTGLIASSESPYASERDLIQVSECEKKNDVESSESSVCLAEPNSGNVPKAFYMIQMKNSKTTSESRILDGEHVNTDSGSTLTAGVEMGENLPESVTMVVSGTETILDTPNKNELLESQGISALQESESKIRSKTSTPTNFEEYTKTVCLSENKKLEIAPQYEESEEAKKRDSSSLCAPHMVVIKAIPSFVREAEDKELKVAKAAETIVTLAKSKGSKESVDIVKDISTELSDDINAYSTETFKRSESTVVTQISESLLITTGIPVEHDAKLVVTESVSDSIIGSEKEGHDPALTEFMMDVKIAEANSSIQDTSERNTSKTTLQFETTSKPPCMLDSMDLDDNVDFPPKIETKDSRQVINYVRPLEVKDSNFPAATSTQLVTPQLKSSESFSVSKETDSAGILNLNPTPVYKGTTEFKSSSIVSEIEVLEISDSGIHLKPENNSEVKYFETPSETENVLQKTAPISEREMEKFSELISEKVCPHKIKEVETILEPKHAQQIKTLETSLQPVYTVGATDLEGNLMSEVLGVSKTNQQFSDVVEKADVRAAISSVTVEAVKDTEKQLQLDPHFEGKCSESNLKSMHVSDLQDADADEGAASLAGKKCSKPVPEVASVIDMKKAKSDLELALRLTDPETMFKPRSVLESVQRNEPKDLEAANKYESFVEVKELQVIQTSTDKEQMDLGGLSKSVLTLESEDLERNSTSVLLPEGKASEGSLDAIHVQVKDSVVMPEYVSANNKEVSKETCRAEVEHFEPTAAHVIESRNSEMISQAIVQLKNSESALEPLNIIKEKDLGGISQIIVEEQGVKVTAKPVCPVAGESLEVVQEITVGLIDPEPVLESVKMAEKDLEAGKQVIVAAKDSEIITLKSTHVTKEKDLEIIVQDYLKDKDSEAVTEHDGSILKDKKSEKISSKSKDKSKSKKAKKSRSKSPSKSKKHKKKSRSHSTTRQVASRRERSRSKHDSHSRKKHSTSRRKSRSKSTDKKEDKESSKSRRRRSRSKSRSKSVDRIETSAKSRRRRSRSSDHRKSRSKSIDKRESVRRRRRLSRSSDKHKSRSRSAERRETLIRSRRRRSRSSDHQKSRSRSADKRETSVRTRRRRSRSSDRYRSRSKSLDRRESSVRTRRRQSRSSDHHKSRSRSADDKKEISVRRRRRHSRSHDTRKSRSRSTDRRETTVRARRRRSRSSDRHKSRSRSVDKRESSVRTRRRKSRSSDNCRSKSRSVDKRNTSVRTRRRRSRSSDNRRSKSKSVDKRESSVKRRRRRSLSSDRKSRSKSVEKRETSAQVKRKRSRSSDTRKSRSKSVEASARSKRKRSKSADHKSRAKSVEKEEPSLRSRRRKSKSSDCQISKSKSRSKSTERKKDKDSSVASREKHSRHRSKSKSIEKTEGSESLDISVCNHAKSPVQHKSKSRSRSKSIDKMDERDSIRRSKSKGSKSPESRSRRRRTVSRSRRNRSRSLTRRRTSRSKSDHRSRTRSRSRSQSRSRRWRRTRSRSLSRQRSLSRERRRRSRRNRSRSPDRRRRRSDSRDSYRISLRLRSRSRTPVLLRSSRSTGRRRSPSKSPDHRRSRSSSRSPKRLTDLDKAQLLEIAKANAAAMCAKAGVPLPPSLMPVVTPEKKEEKVTQKSAKETILELTEKCKKIAQSQEDDVIVNKPHVSDEEEEEHPFINHPFKLNEPKPIFFNLTTPTIKPPPPKNQVTLTKEFPVSSGSQHRKKEADSAYGEWVPVEKNKDEKKDDVFPNPANLEPVDISSALNERTIAQKRLTENTFDLEAMCLLNRAQERIDAWAELNSIPGHFTGSTGAQVLSSEQLSNSGPQAWVKKDQFLRAAPVTGGMGAQLMRKMGWREGEGLGKNKEGNKEPILVDFKTDRKGLVAVGEKTQKRHGPFSAVKDLSGKHPVSALLEVCNKRRWSPPVFVLVNDNRPEYRKHFLFKVMVNGVEHKPTFVSPNKKHAKAMAATVALQALGLVPKDLFTNATSFRSASHN
ncbi:LOW QUALITY PROTEIN: protein SON [Sceloporus undulatus]|uniref:LOW QUALITY PROTEIN: protein SON n=1 Tax=Sceloporus undulatus TaxID=8520 RepID=UPI001C4B862A|nr:LOW QUALITY PROTEIN: protein SON [Sceloporus undulatus]